MQKKQVAVLDVGSSKITAVIAERGINKTFVIKALKNFEYDGFGDGAFFDVEGYKRVIHSCGQFVKTFGHGLSTVYVGVPGEFTGVMVKDSQISFPKKKRVTEADIDQLFDGAFALPSAKSTLINRSAVVYELDDYRRLANPVGELSEILKGKLSFVVCSNYFIENTKSALRAVGFNNVEFISTALAEAMYLLDAESRDRIAMIVDIGYISTTFSLIQCDGILYQSSFGFGGGYITAALTQEYDIDFNQAESLKRKINVSRISNGTEELISLNNGSYYNPDDVRVIIKACLDELCERITDKMDKSGYVIPEYVPVMITGGGIAFIRGGKEHLSNRIGCQVDLLVPGIPISDNPTEASTYSLLDLAIG